ncbi:glycosyltransferase family 4 protein [Planktothrix paucivesiculata]|uniref:Glycosyl transferase group 1 n=1 Tax=Planktothrix paucivesiculata PCC 9631 TaxID=671071 RepID=A0A7Z9DY45_9CYAN|nr:glycosyltransferase family 4 protein [Planktothrix paucivesiculata]VXD12560.1 Glycosyl transferase group 1 [Planktothrix paucivesiculata PCC 9631]
MRILIYSYNYHPEPIGIAPLMTELAEGLVRRGHEVRVVTGMPNYPERRIYPGYQNKLYLTEERNGVVIQRSYIWVRGPKPGLLDRLLLDSSFIATSLVQAFNGWRPDLIFATVPPLLVSIPVGLYAGARRCPVILNIQDIVSEAALRVKLVNPNGIVIKTAKFVEQLTYEKVNRISVIADGFVNKLVELGIPKDKIVYIPNWVDTNFIKPLSKTNNSFRIKYQLENKFVVLYSGNIALTQGLETVIKAAKLLEPIPEISFIIAGEQEALQNLEKVCQEHQAENVILIPLEPREKLPEMLAAADVGLVVQKRQVTAFNLPSKIPVLLASGCAIIGSVPDTGTAKDVILKSGGGIVVPPEDAQSLAQAITDLHKNPAQLDALGQSGRKYAEEHYGIEQALDQYERLFKQVLSQE